MALIQKINLDPSVIIQNRFNDIESKIKHSIVTDDMNFLEPIRIMGFGSYKYADLETGEEKSAPFKLFTLGNISAIKGASKAQKTFLISLFAGTYLNVSNPHHAQNISVADINKQVVIFDTEQHKTDVYKVRQRINRITGYKNQNLFIYSLREFDYLERIEIIETEIKKYRDAFVIIDGIADLMRDINDFGEGSDVTSKLMKWSSEQNCHILTVIHNNYSGGKPTGHIGSTLLKKAENIINIEQPDKKSATRKVSCEYIRGSRPFPDFFFEVDEYTGLPNIVSENNSFIDYD